MQLVLCTNNKYNDPFLYSQLLDIYMDLGFIKKQYLFCRCKKKTNYDGLINIDYGKFSFFIYFLKLLFLALKLDTNTIFHVRGYVSAFIFYFIKKCLFWKKFKYIYDPRGAFILELSESRQLGKNRLLSSILKKIEKNIISGSLKTIVTTKRFQKFFSQEYNNNEKYVVLYNSSTLKPLEFVKEDFQNKDLIKICYMGSIDFWHNLDEIVRVLKHVEDIIPQKTKVYFLTSHNKDKVKEKLLGAGIKNFEIDFVPYREIAPKLDDMDICLSIVMPTTSQTFASPIKISDYINRNKIIVMNYDIGDFDQFFIENNSVMLYKYGEELSFSFKDLMGLNRQKNHGLIDILSIGRNRQKIINILNGHL